MVHSRSAWCRAAADFRTPARPGGLRRPGPVPNWPEGRPRPSHTLGAGCGMSRRRRRAQNRRFLRVFCGLWRCPAGSMRLLAGVGGRGGRFVVRTGRPERLVGRSRPVRSKNRSPCGLSFCHFSQRSCRVAMVHSRSFVFLKKKTGRFIF